MKSMYSRPSGSIYFSKVPRKSFKNNQNTSESLFGGSNKQKKIRIK